MTIKVSRRLIVPPWVLTNPPVLGFTRSESGETAPKRKANPRRQKKPAIYTTHAGYCISNWQRRYGMTDHVMGSIAHCFYFMSP